MFALAACSAIAQDYPTKTVRIIVASAPGGGYDFTGRLLAERLSQELGQPFVVENRVGGGTVLGTQTAAAATADGYTLVMGGLANMAFNLAMHKDLSYDPVRDFTPVAMVGAFTYALVGRKDLPASNMRELIAYARANPGKLTIATSGVGTGQHVSALLLQRFAKVDLLVINYKGAQPAYADLLPGRVDLFFDNTTTARPFIADGRVKPFVTSGPVRDILLPEVPTAAEAGMPDFVLDSWIGLFAPARTPQVAIDRLRVATLKAVESPEARRKLEAAGWRVISMSAEDTRAFVRREAEKWPALLRQAGLKPE